MVKRTKLKTVDDAQKCCHTLFLRALNTACNRSVRRAKGQRFNATDRDAVLALLFLHFSAEICKKLEAQAGQETLTQSATGIVKIATKRKRKAPPRDPTTGKFLKRA